MRCSFEGKKGLIITVFHFFLFHSFLYLPFFIVELLFFLFHSLSTFSEFAFLLIGQ